MAKTPKDWFREIFKNKCYKNYNQFMLKIIHFFAQNFHAKFVYNNIKIFSSIDC